MKALIVDGHALIRSGLSHIITQRTKIDTVIQGESHSEIFNLIERTPDLALLILDIEHDQETSTATIELVKETSPKLKISILSVLEIHSLTENLFSAGIDGYIPKSTSNELIVSAINLIIAGGIFYPEFYNANVRSRDCQLSERQKDVLPLVAKGMSNKEIANNLALSESTIKTHVSAILEQLDVNSRIKAVNKAIEVGLID